MLSIQHALKDFLNKFLLLHQDEVAVEEVLVIEEFVSVPGESEACPFELVIFDLLQVFHELFGPRVSPLLSEREHLFEFCFECS